MMPLYSRNKIIRITLLTVAVFIMSQLCYFFYLTVTHFGGFIPIQGVEYLMESISDHKLTLFKQKVNLLMKLYATRIRNINQTEHEKDICKRYFKEGKEAKSVVPHIWKSITKLAYDDVTLVTQIGEDKIPILENLLKHWDGPMSVAMYISMDQNSINQTTDKILHSPTLLMRDNIQIHLVAKEGEFYPVNYLRNVALNNTITKYVYLADVDFMPNYGIHDYVKSMLNNENFGDKEVFVVPAFEFHHPENITEYPKTKHQLVHIWNTRNVMPFHWGFKPGHGPTNYKLWINATEPYEAIFHDAYEPYIVMRTHQVPLYNTTFLGRYGNKISHLLEVHSAGFRFKVLPEAYMIHYPHHIGGVHHMRCTSIAITDFKKLMKIRYKTS